MIMNTEELKSWAAKVGLTSSQRMALTAVLAAAPIRSTMTGSSVRGFYPSAKNGGRQVGFSSRTAEFPCCIALEFDPNVISYVEQPVELLVTYALEGGKPAAHKHIPDYLALTKTGPVFYECKHTAKLEASRLTTPGRFVLEDGLWRCPSAEADARERFGARYEIAVAESLSPILTENLLFLQAHAAAEIDPVHSRRVTQMVSANPGVTVGELQKVVPIQVVWSLLNQQAIHADFQAISFTSPDHVTVYLTREALDLAKIAASTAAKEIVTALVGCGPDAHLTIDGVRHQILSVTDRDIHLVGRDQRPIQMSLADLHRRIKDGHVRCIRTPDIAQAAREMILTRTAADIADATEKFAAIAQLVGAKVSPPPGTRSFGRRQLNRLAKRYRAEERLTGFGLAGLLRKKPPGRPRSIDEPRMEIFRQVVDEHYKTTVRIKGISAYARFCHACTAAALQPFSARTFYYQLGKLRRFETTLAREGSRAARKFAGPEYLHLEQSTPVHGTFAWEVGHIDATKIDLVVKCTVSGAILKKRATLMILTLALTRRVVAFHLGFEGETTRSVFALFRNCVARNGQLPAELVMDNGPAFASDDTKACCGALGITVFYRPPDSGRGGSVVERMFGTTNTELLAQIPGNTQATKRVKEMVDETNPYERDDQQSLERAIATLGHYFFEAFDTRLHVALGNSPREFEKLCIAKHGDRPGRMIADTEEFRILTSTSYGRITVQERYGVQVLYQSYMCPQFATAGLGGTKVEVRLDDWDGRVVYAHVHGRWVRCVSKALFDRFGELDSRQLAAATATLRAAQKEAKKSGPVNAQRVIDAIAEAEETERVLLMRATVRARNLAAEMHLLLATTPDVPPAPSSSRVSPEDEKLQQKYLSTVERESYPERLHRRRRTTEAQQ